MSNNNAVAALQYSNLEELLNAIGVMQFFGSANWSLTISGLRIQGGRTNTIAANATQTIAFNEGFPQQCSQVILTALGTAGTAGATPDQNGFVLHNGGVASSYMWVAFGT